MLFFVLYMIPRQRLAQDGYEWSIAGKKDTVETILFIAVFCRGVEFHQSCQRRALR